MRRPPPSRDTPSAKKPPRQRATEPSRYVIRHGWTGVEVMCWRDAVGAFGWELIARFLPLSFLSAWCVVWALAELVLVLVLCDALRRAL